EVPGLILNSQQLGSLVRRRQARLCDTGTNLVRHIVLAHALTELSNTHTHVANRSCKALWAVLAVYLKLRHLPDQRINIRVGKLKTLTLGILCQNGFLNQ